MTKVFHRIRLIAAAVLMVSAAFGCRVVNTGRRGFQAETEENGSERFAASMKLGDGILQAFRDRDFGALVRNTPGELATRVSEKDFNTSCRNFREKFGELEDFRFLTALDTPGFDNLLWRVTFVRRDSEKRELRRQLLVRLVTMPVDGKLQVASYGFM